MLLVSTALVALTAAIPPNPHALVDSAIAAIMHRAPNAAVRTIRLTGIDHTWMLGNAERSEGPWRVFYARFSELYDASNGSLRRTESALSPSGAAGPSRVTILTDSVTALSSGGRLTGGSHGTYEDLVDRADGEPLRALRLAAASSSLAFDRAVSRYGVDHDVVSFPWRNGRMRIELNRVTRLPDAVEIFRTYPDNFRWAPFGDVTMRTDNVDWEVTRSGAYWPMQQKISLNGQPLRDVTYGAAALESTAAPADSFAVTDSARAQFAANSALNFSRFAFGARGQPTELAPGIVRVPDFWAETLVKQADGVVVFEAHISATYFDEILAEAHRRWPGAPIKALVMTSDPWAHLGGVREAMALGIPIYVQGNSVAFLTSLANSPHALAPDSLARSQRAPKFMPVNGKTVIGTGDNRIELYPIRGTEAERMVMAYFPARKLLYGADLVFSEPDANGKSTGHFLETEATDLRRAVAREGLAVDRLFCVQNSPVVQWADFVQPSP